MGLSRLVFTSTQDNILEALGCSPGSLGHVAGGIDTHTAEQMVAKQCSITLPRIAGNYYVSLLDECGGHTKEYHFHERLSCLYTTAAGSTHSGQVGKMNDGKYLYGKWEDSTANQLPLLDACGGHFGTNPDSATVVYHYHVQEKAPFTLGCFGPVTQSDGTYKLVTVAECRALYSGCGDGDETTVVMPTESKTYDYWCPCWDASGSNAGTAELPVFSSGAITTIPATTPATTTITTAATTTPTPTAATTTAAAAAAAAAATTTTMITTSTTPSPILSPTPSAAAKVTGSMALSVANPAAFAADPVAKQGIKIGLATHLGIPSSYLEVTLTAARRRLVSSAEEEELRRRLAGSVSVDYTITIPAGASVSSESVRTSLVSASSSSSAKASLASAIVSAVNTAATDAGQSTYTVTLETVAEPSPVISVTTTPTPTTTKLNNASSAARTGCTIFPCSAARRRLTAAAALAITAGIFILAA
ncbi:unnamed protein product [Polarella glacialis]|uniref:YHYH domain-containing protein n=1 Tax=Polarella glacialis TaxID=89957 RepID=A0A813DKL0_POLGL|nr:unnamed protein product [Polarella glacialis]